MRRCCGRAGPHSAAASLLQSIVGNHALIDGNKRLGWLATAVFLEINGHSVATAENNDVFNLVINIASNKPALGDRLGSEADRAVMSKGWGLSGCPAFYLRTSVVV